MAMSNFWRGKKQKLCCNLFLSLFFLSKQKQTELNSDKKCEHYVSKAGLLVMKQNLFHSSFDHVLKNDTIIKYTFLKA